MPTRSKTDYRFSNPKIARRVALGKRFPITQAQLDALCRQATATTATTAATVCPPCTELPQPKAGNRSGFKAARQARAMMR